MNLFKYVKNYLVSCGYLIREKFNPSSITSGKEVPIIIKN